MGDLDADGGGNQRRFHSHDITASPSCARWTERFGIVLPSARSGLAETCRQGLAQRHLPPTKPCVTGGRLLNHMAATTVQFASAVPQFTVSDVARTAEYYRDVLGFKIAGFWDGERVHHDARARVVFAIVRRDDVRLHFSRDEQADVRTRDTESYDVYFHVTGVDALADDFRKRGASILDGPEDRVYGQRELVVRDCNGLILAFGEETGGRAA